MRPRSGSCGTTCSSFWVSIDVVGRKADLRQLFESRIRGSHRLSEWRTIRDQDIASFSRLTGDFGRIHIDRAYALSSGFRGVVAQGLLTLSVVTSLASAAKGFSAVLSYGYESTHFVRPVIAGDEIRVGLEPVRFDARDETGAILGMSYTTRNQEGQVVLATTHLMLVDPSDLFKAWITVEE